MTDSHVMYTTCPHCGQKHDRVSGMTTKSMPRVGDITLCINCGGWNEYDEDLELKEPSEETKKEMEGDENIEKMNKFYRQMKGLH